MSSPCQSACSPWATADDVCGPCTDYSFDPIILDDALAMATDVLYELSGRRFPGSCADIVRPVGVRSALAGWRRWDEANWRSSFRGDIPCSCGQRWVGCATVPAVPLAPVPITSIVEVLVDGAVVDPSTYRIDDFEWLVSTTNPDTGVNTGWPCCQRLDLPTTELGTFSVEYTYGVMPPAMGVRAAAALGCQLALSCAEPNSDDCALPERVTSITRQGVSMVVIDPFDFLDDGKTGIYEVDLFLKAANPGRLARPAVVLTPDQFRRVRTTG